ncbi:hypothetical protein SO802_022412 [Lithocarpus litseifolius]|uniref:Maturase K n=1 Tax=Lithocarpus litseifolius TaxID=425828 RepID=A0AAW2CHN6_9ROSI
MEQRLSPWREQNHSSRTLYFFLIIVKSLQLRGRKQIAEPRKYCLVRVIVFLWRVWEFRVKFPIPGSFSNSFQLVQERHQLASLFATTAWSIWQHRNKFRLQESPLPLKKIAGFAEDYLRSFTDQFSSTSIRRWQVVQKWSPLIQDTIKTNFDGA